MEELATWMGHQSWVNGQTRQHTRRPRLGWLLNPKDWTTGIPWHTLSLITNKHITWRRAFCRPIWMIWAPDTRPMPRWHEVVLWREGWSCGLIWPGMRTASRSFGGSTSSELQAIPCFVLDASVQFHLIDPSVKLKKRLRRLRCMAT